MIRLAQSICIGILACVITSFGSETPVIKGQLPAPFGLSWDMSAKEVEQTHHITLVETKDASGAGATMYVAPNWKGTLGSKYTGFTTLSFANQKL